MKSWKISYAFLWLYYGRFFFYQLSNKGKKSRVHRGVGVEKSSDPGPSPALEFFKPPPRKNWAYALLYLPPPRISFTWSALPLELPYGRPEIFMIEELLKDVT